MISDGLPAEHDIVLPTRLILRESCGCPPELTSPARRAG
jgi:hypothetical protein